MQMRHASRPPARDASKGPREGMGLRIPVGPHRDRHLHRGAVHRIASPPRFNVAPLGCRVHRRAGAQAPGARTPIVHASSPDRTSGGPVPGEAPPTQGGTTDRIIRCRCCSAVYEVNRSTHKKTEYARSTKPGVRGVLPGHSKDFREKAVGVEATRPPAAFSIVRESSAAGATVRDSEHRPTSHCPGSRRGVASRA